MPRLNDCNLFSPDRKISYFTCEYNDGEIKRYSSKVNDLVYCHNISVVMKVLSNS